MDYCRDIPGYEGLYLITRDGEIYNNCGKKRKLRYDGYGYLRLDLSKNNIRKTYRLHRLLALTFIKNSYNYPCVDHKDGNIKNNNLNNLRWTTYRGNSSNRILKGSIQKNRNKYYVRIFYKPNIRTNIIFDSKIKAKKFLKQEINKLNNNRINRLID